MTKQEYRNEIEQRTKKAEEVLKSFFRGEKTLEEVKSFLKARVEEESSRGFYFSDEGEKIYPTEWEKQSAKKYLFDMIDDLRNDDSSRLSLGSNSIIYTIYG